MGPTVARRAVKSFGWASASMGANRLVVFLTTLVLARLLVPDEFGAAAAALVVASFFQIALDAGLGAAVVYEQEASVSERVRTALTVNVAVTAVLGAAFLALAGPFAALFGTGTDDAVFQLAAVYLVVRGLGQVHDAVLQRNLEFRRRTVIDVVRVSVRAGVSILLAARDPQATAILWGLLAGEVVATGMLWSAVRLRPVLRPDGAVARDLLRYGSHVLGGRVVGEVAVNADYVVVGSRLGAGPLGLYAIAFRLPELVIASVFWAFSTTAFPVFSKARAEGRDVLRRAVLRALRLTTLFGFTVGAGMALASRDAVVTLFSAQWAAAATPMALLSLAIGLQGVGYAFGDALKAIGAVRTFLVIQVLFAVLAVAGFLAVVDRGTTAVAAVHLAVVVVNGVAFVVAGRVLLGLAGRDVAAAMGPALATTAGVVAFALPVRLVVPVGAGGLLAVVGAGLLGGVVGLLAGGRGAIGDLRAASRHLVARAR